MYVYMGDNQIREVFSIYIAELRDLIKPKKKKNFVTKRFTPKKP